MSKIDLVKIWCDLTESASPYLSRLPWDTKLFRVALGIVGVLTARKVLDYVRRKWYHYPPGPVGLPFLGTILSFDDVDYQMACHKKYGPISMTHFGLSNVVFINDYKLLQKYFKKAQFWDREPLVDSSVTDYEPDFASIRMTPEWQARRKLLQTNVISKLSSSFLTTILAKVMKENIFPIIEGKDSDSKSNNNNNSNNSNNGEHIWYIRKECNYISFATIYVSTFGDPCPGINDKSFIEYKNRNNEHFASLSMAIGGRLLFPEIKSIRQWLVAKSNFYGTAVVMQSLVSKWAQKFDKNNNNATSNNSDSNVNTNLYYQAIKDSVANIDGTNNEGYITNNTGIADMFSAFAAGMHTTATALEQCILYLAKCGESLQNEIFDEITPFITHDISNDNGGGSGDYNYDGILKNRNHLHKLGSFVYEILRNHGFIWVTLARRLIEKEETVQVETENGIKKRYILPKSCVVFGSVYSINHDANIWEKELHTGNVFEFNPKRFIDPKTKKMEHGKGSIKSYVTTFGAGRRNCVGQELAVKELYLVVAILINNYVFHIPTKYNGNYDIPRMFFKPTTPMLGVVAKKRRH